MRQIRIRLVIKMSGTSVADGIEDLSVDEAVREFSGFVVVVLMA